MNNNQNSKEWKAEKQLNLLQKKVDTTVITLCSYPVIFFRGKNSFKKIASVGEYRRSVPRFFDHYCMLLRRKSIAFRSFSPSLFLWSVFRIFREENSLSIDTCVGGRAERTVARSFSSSRKKTCNYSKATFYLNFYLLLTNSTQSFICDRIVMIKKAVGIQFGIPGYSFSISSLKGCLLFFRASLFFM